MKLLLLILWMGYVNMVLFSVVLSQENKEPFADVLKTATLLSVAQPDLGSCERERDDIAKTSLCCTTLTKLVAAQGPTLTTVQLANTFIKQEPAIGVFNLEDTVRTCKLNHTDDIILPFARQLLNSTTLRNCTSFLRLDAPINVDLLRMSKTQVNSCCPVLSHVVPNVLDTFAKEVKQGITDESKVFKSRIVWEALFRKVDLITAYCVGKSFLFNDLVPTLAQPDLGSCEREKDSIAKKSLCCPTLTKLVAAQGATLTAVQLANTFIENEPALGVSNLEDTVRTCKLSHTDDIILPLARQLLNSTTLRPCTPVLRLDAPIDDYLLIMNKTQVDSCCRVIEDLTTELHYRGFNIEQEEINNNTEIKSNASLFGKRIIFIRELCARPVEPASPKTFNPGGPLEIKRTGFKRFGDYNSLLP